MKKIMHNAAIIEWMHRLGIFTSDFRFYHDAVKLLKEWSLPFESLESRESVPGDVLAVLTSERDEFEVEKQVRGANALQALRRSLPRLVGKTVFARIVIGIDPGPKPGVAVVCDGVVSEALEISALSVLPDYISGVLADYPYIDLFAMVGNGDKPNRDVIVESMRKLGVRVIIVDERSTTIPHKRENNALSAAIIAMAQDRKYDPRTRGRELSNVEKKFVTFRAVL